MNNRHKYFRNLRYKQKLETKYNNRSNYGWTGVYFVTDEVDPRFLREATLHHLWRSSYLTAEENIQRKLEQNCKKYRGHDFYLYYDRPEVAYSMIESTDRPYGKAKKFYKKYTNRVIRHSKDTPQHNQYRKYFDLWWAID